MTDDANESPAPDISGEWGIRPDSRIWVGGNHSAAKRAVHRYLQGTVHPPMGTIQLAFIAPLSVNEAVYFAEKLRPRLEVPKSVWIVIPKPGSSLANDWEGNLETLAERMGEAQWTKEVSVDVTREFVATRFTTGE